MSNNEIIKYWLETSDEDYDTMLILYENKKYSQSLFFGQLVLERLLKAIYLKKNNAADQAPFTHNLVKLLDGCKIETTSENRQKLGEITFFNIEARYEDVKRDFNKKCTKDYTAKQIEHIKGLRKWLKTLI